MTGTPTAVVVDAAGQFAYVTRKTANQVDVVSIANKSVVASINVGTAPAGLDLTPDGTKLYVANSGSANISVVNVATRTELRKIPVPPVNNDNPLSIATLTDGTAIFTNTFGGSGGGVLRRVNLTTDAISPDAGGGDVPNISEHSYVRASQDHTRVSLMVGNDSGGYSYLYSTVTHNWARNHIDVFLRDIAINGNGSRVLLDTSFSSWFTNGSNTVTGSVDASQGHSVAMSATGTGYRIDNGSVEVLDSDHFLVTGTLTLPDAVTTVNSNGVQHAVVTPNGSTLVAITDNGVSIISTANPTPVPPPTPTGTATVPIGGTLSDVVVDSAGQFAYATNQTTNRVQVVSLASNTVVATIPVGSKPLGLDLTPDGTKLYVANSGGIDISVVDVATRVELRRIPIPAGSSFDRPGYIAIGANGKAVVTTASGFGWGRLLSLTLANDAISLDTGVDPNGLEYGGVVRASADRTHVTMISVGLSNGNVAILTTASGLWVQNDLNVNLDHVAVNGNGSKSLIDSRVVNGSGTLLGTVPGVAFYGVALNAAGTVGYRVQTGSIDVLNTATFSVASTLSLPDGIASANGHVALTPDGTKLVVITDGGLSVVHT
jgi:YVTN family beta-propeller protein